MTLINKVAPNRARSWISLHSFLHWRLCGTVSCLACLQPRLTPFILLHVVILLHCPFVLFGFLLFAAYCSSYVTPSSRRKWYNCLRVAVVVCRRMFTQSFITANSTCYITEPSMPYMLTSLNDSKNASGGLLSWLKEHSIMQIRISNKSLIMPEAGGWLK